MRILAIGSAPDEERERARDRRRRPELGRDAVVGQEDSAVMTVIILLIAAGGMVASGFLAAFVWAVRSGQFDDTCTPAVRVLLDARIQNQDPRPKSQNEDQRSRISAALPVNSIGEN